MKKKYIDLKNKNISNNFNQEEIYSLIKRVSSTDYANKIKLKKVDGDGFDYYNVTDDEDYILIEATSGGTAAYAFNQYLKERCGYSIGALSTSGSLPAKPPKVGNPLSEKSCFLYRYFFNYCTFSYTYAFDTWVQWEKMLDYLILSGYNLILNPIGIESVWRNVLLNLGYSKKDINKFICGPAFYAWQWMMNLSGWLGGAPDWWYDERVELAGKINLRLQAFDIGIVGAGYVGMVPSDFNTYFPNSRLVEQGEWFGYVRPCFILPNDVNYEKIASLYYSESKKIKGAENIKYFSADPFHEGGITKGIDLASYGKLNYERMCQEQPDAVWVIQGWSKPQPDIINSIPDGNIMVVNLLADTTEPRKDLFDGAPWCYCAVNCFGGQYNFQGDAESILLNPFKRLHDGISNIVGIGYMPEAVNCNEVIYQIVSQNAFGERYKTLDDFLRHYVTVNYGAGAPSIEAAWKELCIKVLNGKQYVSGESALCARPSLDVEHVSAWSVKPNPFVDQTVIIDYIKAMLDCFDEFSASAIYRKDLVEATRQAISNLSWYFVEMIRQSYKNNDIDGVSYYGKELLSLFDLQTAVVTTDESMLLGIWLEKAKALGKTSAEKAYFELNARMQITLWGNEQASKYLHDYSAREWQGLLEDFYKPRWEVFISRLEISLLTGTEFPGTQPYHEEIPFVYQKKEYPTQPSGDLKKAVENALEKIQRVKLITTIESTNQKSFAENVFDSIDC